MSQALLTGNLNTPNKKKQTLRLVVWSAITIAEIAAIVAGCFFLDWLLDGITGISGYQLNDAAFAASVTTTVLAAGPFLRFISVGWDSRYSEIRNRLDETALYAYLIQFWEQRFREKLPSETLHNNLRDCKAPKDKELVEKATELFEEIYNEQYSRWAFLLPIILVLATVAAETIIIVFAFTAYKPAAAPAADPYGYAWQTFGAMAGTYMFVVSDSVMAVRRRTLNISDVYWYALRLVLAVPVGMAVYKVGGDFMGAFVLGTLPIDQFRKVLARYAGSNFIDLEAAQTTDQLIQLEGVTADISAIIGLEGR